MFFLRKEFVGDKFTVNGVHVGIVDRNIQSKIIKKFEKLYAIYKHGKMISVQVDYREVFKIQNNYIES